LLIDYVYSKEVANTANQFTQFPEVSSALMIRCAEVIKESLKTPAKMLQFATDQSGTGNEELVEADDNDKITKKSLYRLQTRRFSKWEID
jgi:hypothetical protein